jgi:flagellar basal body P-ring protein FlgI
MLIILSWVFFIGSGGGCESSGPRRDGSGLLGDFKELGDTIGSLTTVYSPESVAIEGYGLVGGLKGTGSSECPPALRAYLKRYILKELPDQRIDVDKLIDSRNTAIVHVVGRVPLLEARESRFDVAVVALAGTQTTSLEGGWLYATELRVAGGLGAGAGAIGNAAGPIFTDYIGEVSVSRKMGYLLAGARMSDRYRISLVFHKAAFEATSRVRNRINERFGFEVAEAAMPGRIELRVPNRYARQKRRFVALVQATYMTENPEITPKRILAHIRELATSEDKYAAEIALEAIGNESLGKLSVLLNSSNESVRLHAARCMLNLGGSEGLNTLIEIAADRTASLRVEALEAITASANRSDAAAISRRLLSDSDFNVRIAAYEQLLRLEDPSVDRQFVGRTFYLDRVGRSTYKGVFASRSGEPRIALLGAPIRCRDNIFVRSDDGTVVLNAPKGQGYVSIIRKEPGRSGIVGQIRSSYNLADIIRVLCEEPRKSTDKGVGGLGVSYSEMIAIVKQLSDKGVISAEFQAGPTPKIGVNIKK